MVYPKILHWGPLYPKNIFQSKKIFSLEIILKYFYSRRRYSGAIPTVCWSFSGSVDCDCKIFYNFRMAKTDKTPEISRDEIDFRTEPERMADDKIEMLEAELAALQPGVQVIIERLKPSWCKGQLEKLTVDEDGLDIDYLIQNWGGQLLSIKIIGQGNRIRGSHSVELYSFEPRRYGKLLRPPNAPNDDEPSTVAGNPVVVQSPPAQDNSEFMIRMMDMLNAQRQSEVETLRLMLQQQQSAPAPSPAYGGVTDFLKMATAFNKVKEIFQSDQQPMSSNPDEMFPMQIMDLVGKFIQTPDAQRAPLVPPQQKPAPAPSPPIPATLPRSNPTPAPFTSIRQDGGDLVTQISQMEPELAADVLLTALGKMPPEKQEAAFEIMRSRFEKIFPELFDYFEDEDEEPDDAAVAEQKGQGVREK